VVTAFMSGAAVVVLFASSGSASPRVGSVGSVEWAPGSAIAFTAGTYVRPRGLFVIRSDGGGLVRLADFGFAPRWSPAGDLVAFGNEELSIYVVRSDGSGLRRLRKKAQLGGWSPDGSRLLFTTVRGAVWMMRRDGSDAVHLTTIQSEESEVAWSPDGRAIAFLDCRAPESSRCAHTSRRDVYVLRLGGTGTRRRVTRKPVAEGCLTWAPGRQIAFAGRSSVFVADPSRVGQRVVIPNAACPSWSPDGRWLAASGWRAPLIAHADGTGLHRVALLRRRSFVVPGAPAWSPDSRSIAFIWPTGSSTGSAAYRLFTADAAGGHLMRLTH
jgi:Tol biopolymer transport system component